MSKDLFTARIAGSRYLAEYSSSDIITVSCASIQTVFAEGSCGADIKDAGTTEATRAVAEDFINVRLFIDEL